MAITVDDSGDYPSESTVEWAAATNRGGMWALLAEPTADRTAAEETAKVSGGVVISREVSTWQTVRELRPKPAVASDDEVNRIIEEENGVIRDALLRGVSIVLVRPHKPRERVLHRIGCPGLTSVLNRQLAWTQRFRERLAEDPEIRPPLPTFHTREDAQNRLAGIRQCGACEPELHGATRALRRVRADGLSDRHLGLTLASDGGTPLGIITDVDTHTSASNYQRYGAEQVTITTDNGVHNLSGTDIVTVVGSISPARLTRGEERLRTRLGLS
ncbi:hypothetical protein [Curtobacterium sp. MCSS17_016]|uniref:hypothetical protein n=1 Tax=Curtobacterium sp. MCSS17_016 TaxID=2175644 RepID=UPI000DA8A918|nr:hypothetical protein [Curtobacterium sp. MCSS17_016]WIE81110.1 hypothetical protein DEJ19_021785 [Curtobacterium sp. MCSS17_016]